SRVYSLAENEMSTEKSTRIVDIFRGRVPLGSDVRIEGWVRTRRDSKAGLSFVQVYDGSTVPPLQIVATRDLPNYESEVLRLTSGVEASGWVDDPGSQPIQPQPHTFEFLREVAHLRPRTNSIAAVTRVRHTTAMAIHRFFHENGFYWVHTPIITSNAAEGAGE